MRRLASCLVLAVVGAAGLAQDAHACRCIRRPFAQQLASAQVSFIGRAIGRSADGERAVFVVYQHGKGLDASTTRVEVDTRSGTSCRFSATPGVMHHVLARRGEDGALTTGMCSGSKRGVALEPAKLERGVLEEMREAIGHCAPRYPGFGAPPTSHAAAPIQVTWTFGFVDGALSSHSITEPTWVRLEPGWRPLTSCLEERVGQVAPPSLRGGRASSVTVRFDATITNRVLTLANPRATAGGPQATEEEGR